MEFGIMGGVLLLWFVLVVMTVSLMWGLFRNNRVVATVQPPLTRRILEQRYANGEISQEQYLAMLEEIQ